MNKTTLNSQKEKHSTTLLAESDVVPRANPDVNYEISIHALLAESDSKSAQNSGALLRI